MSVLGEVKRRVLFVPEWLVCGLSFATFKFLTRSPRPLDPRETWDRFTKPNRLIKFLEDNYPPKIFMRALLRVYYSNTLMFKNHTYGIVKHYDLSNEFYRLFLDTGYMFYSCADFVHERESLEEAQEHKAARFIQLMEPKPGERILDLGPGWGGMLKKIYAVTGDKEQLTGYTLSKEQKRYTDEKYGFHIELRNLVTTEYEENAFDKIFSIGTFEHVRGMELLPLSQKLRKAIKPSGKIIHQVICQVSDVPPPVLLAGGFGIFPGSELSSLKRHLRVFEESNFRVAHRFILDYRPTLRIWFQRLVEHQEEAIRLVGVRNYNRYLCYFAAAWRLFDNGDLLIVRIVLEPR